MKGLKPKMIWSAMQYCLCKSTHLQAHWFLLMMFIFSLFFYNSLKKNSWVLNLLANVARTLSKTWHILFIELVCCPKTHMNQPHCCTGWHVCVYRRLCDLLPVFFIYLRVFLLADCCSNLSPGRPGAEVQGCDGLQCWELCHCLRSHGGKQINCSL